MLSTAPHSCQQFLYSKARSTRLWDATMFLHVGQTCTDLDWSLWWRHLTLCIRNEHHFGLINAWCLFLFFYPGGPGKHRPKEKKKNKQRLRLRAQNQHSDHLASARSSQWGLKLQSEQRSNAKLLAAAAPIFWPTTIIIPITSLCDPQPTPASHPWPPGRSQWLADLSLQKYMSISLSPQ